MKVASVYHAFSVKMERMVKFLDSYTTGNVVHFSSKFYEADFIRFATLFGLGEKEVQRLRVYPGQSFFMTHNGKRPDMESALQRLRFYYLVDDDRMPECLSFDFSWYGQYGFRNDPLLSFIEAAARETDRKDVHLLAHFSASAFSRRFIRKLEGIFDAICQPQNRRMATYSRWGRFAGGRSGSKPDMPVHIPGGQFEREFSSFSEEMEFTPAEQRVAFLVLLFHSSGEIQEELNISENTLKTHLKNIYRKSGQAGKNQFYSVFFSRFKLFSPAVHDNFNL